MYPILKKELNVTDDDIYLLWNTDGLPISHSSKGDVWLVQAQPLNVPFKYRRKLQKVIGIYYSRVKKPNMGCFLKPLTISLQDLYKNGIKWFDSKKNEKTTRVIAPLAPLDAPAKAVVMNIMQHNSDCSCPICEMQGKTVKTGKGHCHVFPEILPKPILRTKERMRNQGLEASSLGLENIKGVKGSSIVELIPGCDRARSFPPEPLHTLATGVFKLKLNLWFNPKYHEFDFYIQKKYKKKLMLMLKKLVHQIISRDLLEV